MNYKTILIAGGSSGMGLESAKLLAQSGYKIVIVARNQERNLAVIKNLPKHEGIEHLAYSFDFIDTQNIEFFIDEILQDTSIDGLLYCVGIGNSQKLKKLTYDLILPVMQANFFSFVELVRCIVTKRKTKEQFNIVALSSLASTSANTKYYTAYTSSKAAMEGAIRVLASELVSKNCSICGLKPGYVKSERLALDELLHPDLEQYLKKSGFQPGGIIDPVCVAQTVKLLLEMHGFAFTGSLIPINAAAIS